MTEYVAECYWPGVKESDLANLDALARAASDREVRYLSSMLMPEDEVVFCFFDGPSAEAVGEIARRAHIPFERIVASVRAPN